MEKIRELLEECGVKPELSGRICEALENYTTAYKKKVDAEYLARVEAAKRICVEETEAHKLELGRRLQIFCEAKNLAIEQLVSKQAAIREGEASTLLQQISALLDGIPATGDPALRQEVDRLRQQNTSLAEERNRAVEKANRQTELAERVMKRNRLLETRQVSQEVLETRQPRRQPLNESTTRPRTPVPAGSRRIDGGRRSGQTVTTRAPLVESQDPHPPVDRRQGNLSSRQATNFTPEDIANQIEE